MQNSQLQNSLHNVFALPTDLDDFLFSGNLAFHEYFDELFEEGDLSFSFFFNGENLKILGLFVLHYFPFYFL